MRIAQIAPLAETVPPRAYGGTERVVHWLTEELVRQGHKVTLFASGDSVTSGDLVPCSTSGLRDAGVRDHTASLLVMLDRVKKAAAAFDILHFHVDLLQFPAFQNLPWKTLTTLHGRLDLPDIHPIYEAFPHMPLVSISDVQRRPMPPVNWAGTVQHGLPPALIPYSSAGGAYLAFLGRIAAEKRLDRAIDVAVGAATPLKIAAKVDPADRAYFDRHIAPRLHHPLIEFVGEITDEKKGAFLGGALALIFPIDWPEPFGLAMIEAMAAGTPVIAWPNGAAPEVVDEGLTGVLVRSIEEAVQAVRTVAQLDRSEVRRRFEARFTAERMASDYLAIYRRLAERQGALERTAPTAGAG
jgi:glycosyltransferase involved in cell wall biosynthesis